MFSLTRASALGGAIVPASGPVARADEWEDGEWDVEEVEGEDLDEEDDLDEDDELEFDDEDDFDFDEDLEVFEEEFEDEDEDRHGRRRRPSEW